VEKKKKGGGRKKKAREGGTVGGEKTFDRKRTRRVPFIWKEGPKYVMRPP